VGVDDIVRLSRNLSQQGLDGTSENCRWHPPEATLKDVLEVDGIRNIEISVVTR